MSLLIETGTSFFYNDNDEVTPLKVWTKSAYLFKEIKEEYIDHLIISKKDGDTYFAGFDFEYEKEKPKGIDSYMVGSNMTAINRRLVNQQENDGAEMIGGSRHIGSGAIEGFKSDASGNGWQQESKLTNSESFRITLQWLNKICFEAKQVDRRPMMFFRFTGKYDFFTHETDWVLLTRKDFEKRIK